MEIKNLINKPINRKKFFTAAGMSAAGFIILNSFPFNLFSRKREDEIKVLVKINTQSVKRTRLGGKNV